MECRRTNSKKQTFWNGSRQSWTATALSHSQTRPALLRKDPDTSRSAGAAHPTVRLHAVSGAVPTLAAGLVVGHLQSAGGQPGKEILHRHGEYLLPCQPHL
ncbi:uncharacterized protein LOC121138173 isoform X2 [Mesocricetus auratus]|uniref:Uncharacterized protein LOC121138173 isoform X2 n=1 Tax=Mesocricetus auratus TaxID=10036 RepID=A0ABM2X1W8_MESAU|nr:uncharacterized protein LOC121138173 isoform X2 [Mesocricetus auratus]